MGTDKRVDLAGNVLAVIKQYMENPGVPIDREMDCPKRRDRIAIRVEDLSDAQAAILEAARAPEDSKHYDWEFEPPADPD